MGIRISEEVRHALLDCVPVVALESTIVAHGMPVTTNMETMFAVENIVRGGGAIPASVKIIHRASSVVCQLRSWTSSRMRPETSLRLRPTSNIEKRSPSGGRPIQGEHHFPPGSSLALKILSPDLSAPTTASELETQPKCVLMS